MHCKPRGASTREIAHESQQAAKKAAGRRLNFTKYLILIAVLVTFDGACHKSSPPETSPTSSSVGADFWLSKSPVITGHAVKLSDLSESEVRFGIAPKRGPGVTYQDGIILMEQ